jgi:hypothetical protein
LPHTYYRGCWHVVSRGFRQVPSSSRILAGIYSSLLTGLYNPKTFIVHAASLRQAFAHCAKFLTAASRRSLGRISVPVWPFTLSGRLPIVALVGFYPANKLMGRGLISRWKVRRSPPLMAAACATTISFGISHPFEWLSQSWRQIIHVLLTSSPLSPQCKHQGSRPTCMFKTRRQRSF